MLCLYRLSVVYDSIHFTAIQHHVKHFLCGLMASASDGWGSDRAGSTAGQANQYLVPTLSSVRLWFLNKASCYGWAPVKDILGHTDQVPLFRLPSVCDTVFIQDCFDARFMPITALGIKPLLVARH